MRNKERREEIAIKDHLGNDATAPDGKPFRFTQITQKYSRREWSAYCSGILYTQIKNPCKHHPESTIRITATNECLDCHRNRADIVASEIEIAYQHLFDKQEPYDFGRD